MSGTISRRAPLSGWYFFFSARTGRTRRLEGLTRNMRLLGRWNDPTRVSRGADRSQPLRWPELGSGAGVQHVQEQGVMLLLGDHEGLLSQVLLLDPVQVVGLAVREAHRGLHRRLAN